MGNFRPHSPYGIVLSLFFVLIVAILVAEAWGSERAEDFVPKENEPCVGEPLQVDYPYRGGMLDPHACAVQCEDKVQRYIVYTNNKETQCQILPGCLDWGEDKGVTCLPPSL